MTATIVCPGAVFVVDDDEGIRFAIADTLEDSGYRVVAASDGLDALTKLRAEPKKPCLILLDLMMPGMDGWAFRAEQRSDPQLADIPVVVLTADAHVTQKAGALDAQGHIAKPVKLDDLLETANRYCRSTA